MKKFVIINGKNLFCIHAKDMDVAKRIAENNLNHSCEIIVREIRPVLTHTLKALKTEIYK